MADLVFPGAAPGGPINSGAMPSNYDLIIYEGDALRFTVTVKDSAGVPVDLTGYTAKAQLKTNFADASPVDFDCTITTPETDGVVSVYLSPATTAALTAGSSYIWDFQLTSPDSDVRTYLAGDVTVVPEVTT
jgi:hypothetical protein